jgi:4-amino-4-deoxy-L-arabinose transferase-like glycosyltransferase
VSPTARPIRLHLGIVLIAVSIRIAFQFAVVGMQTPPVADAQHYDAVGWRLAQGGSYAAPDGSRSHRAPGYPFLLAAVYRVFGHRLEAARIAQALVEAATCSMLLSLGIRAGLPAVGALAAGAYALFPYAISWSGFLLSEPLCALATVASTWALLKARERWVWTAAWAALCALAALVRPNMATLFLLGLPWVVISPGRRWLRGAGAVLTFGLVLLPWTIRNYEVHHRLVPITTMGGRVLWEGNNPYVVRDPTLRGRSAASLLLPEARLTEGLPEAEADALYFRLGLRFIREHPSEMPSLLAWKMMRLWNLFPDLPSRTQRCVAFLTLLVTLFLFLIGLVSALRAREGWVFPVLVPVLAVVITALVYWADARIRAPADPLILVFASYGGWRLARAGLVS